MDSFIYTASPSRVIFGPGSSVKLPDEIVRQNLHAALILCTSHQLSQASQFKDILGTKCVGIFSDAAMHTPTEITKRALGFAHDLGADCLVSVGGGSTIGLGKAVSIRTGLPHICIPTTYAGSEMTPILGETENGLKTTRRDLKILPGTVIYDVNLTLTLPAAVSATSGVNAIAHAVEALYAPDTNPIIRLLAKEGIRALSTALVAIVRSDQDQSARSQALYGAWLCGICLGSTSMSLHHKLCHTLGGSFDLPHSETHTILLPHTVAYNSLAAPRAMKDVAEVLPNSDGDAVEGLNNLLNELGVERSLKHYGMTEEQISEGAKIAVKNQYYNPREVAEDRVREILRRAWAGEPARAHL